MRARMACSGSPGARAAAHDFVKELLLALVQVGAQLDEVVRPQVDDAVVHLLVVVLAALLRHLWPAEGSGSRPSTAAVHAGRSHPAATWAYTRCRTLSPSGSSWVFSTDMTESSVALSCSLLSTNFSLARLAASWCNSMHSCSLDRRSSSAIAPAPSSTCIMFFCRGARARQTRAEQRVLARRAAGGLRTCTLPCAICTGLARSASGRRPNGREHADESPLCAVLRTRRVLRSAGGLKRPNATSTRQKIKRTSAESVNTLVGPAASRWAQSTDPGVDCQSDE